MDNRLNKLDAWEKKYYSLCMSAFISKKACAVRELNKMRREHPTKAKRAFKVWYEIMAEILYD